MEMGFRGNSSYEIVMFHLRIPDLMTTGESLDSQPKSAQYITVIDPVSDQEPGTFVGWQLGCVEHVSSRITDIR